MKSLLIALATLIGSTANASTIEQYQSGLYAFHMQQGTTMETVNYGQITITPSTNKINLDLEVVTKVMCVRAPCPPIVHNRFNFEVPLLETTIGTCNETIYSGEVDYRRVDGAKTIIKVIDNSSNRCMSMELRNPTVVFLDILGTRGMPFDAKHVMYGSLLSLLK